MHDLLQRVVHRLMIEVRYSKSRSLDCSEIPNLKRKQSEKTERENNVKNKESLNQSQSDTESVLDSECNLFKRKT